MRGAGRRGRRRGKRGRGERMGRSKKRELFVVYLYVRCDQLSVTNQSAA